jgi:hypothetical protein
VSKDLENYIKKSHEDSIKKRKHIEYDNIHVLIKDPLSADFDIDYVFNKIVTLIPDYLLSNVDTVYIGQFEEFIERDINAMYKDGALYTTNMQDNEEDMIDDIVHEIAHSIEEFAGKDLYGDGRVRNEFLGKRQKLYYLLKEEGYNVNLDEFLNITYDKDFDMFLYQDLGYELITNVTMGLFPSPYSVTSLREYFAIGFEHYYLKDRKYIKNISPILFEKLEYISNF